MNGLTRILALTVLGAALLPGAPAVHCRGPWRVAVKTNMLYDAAVVPTAGVEVMTPWRWSVGGDWSYIRIRDYARNRHWRIEGGELYARRWLGSGADALTGHHVGVYGQLYTFQIQLNDRHGFMSGIPGQDLTGRPSWGAGLEYGYSLALSPALNLDFTIGLGYWHSIIQQYKPEDGHYVWERTHRVNWVGPTKAGISLVWKPGRNKPKQLEL